MKSADGEITSTGDNFSHYAYTCTGQGDVASVDNAGTPGVPDVVLASGYDAAGNRKSVSATIGGTKDFLTRYSYNTLSQLDEIDQQGQSGGNAVAMKSIYFGLDAIGDMALCVTGPHVAAPGSEGMQRPSPGLFRRERECNGPHLACARARR